MAAGCGGNSQTPASGNDSQSTGSPDGSSDSQQQGSTDGDTIRIGTILSVTGPAGYLGDKMRQGAELAVEEINASGGINGKKIEWFFYDSAFDSAKAVSQTRRLIYDDKVHAIVGGGSASGLALAMAPITEEAGIVFMATEGAREIVEPRENRPLTFKATFNDTEIIERTIQFWKERGITRVAFIPDTSGFGQSALEVMEELAPAAGIELFVESFDPSVQDMTPQLTRLRQHDPQAYLAWTATSAGVVFLKNAEQLGLGENALIQNGFGFVDDRFMVQAGNAAVGSLLTSPKLPVWDQLPEDDPVRARNEEFVKLFRDKYNEDPNVYAGQTYDGMHLVAEAIRRAGTTDAQAVAAALEGIEDFVGVTGVHTFSPESHRGLLTEQAVIIRWNGERFELVTD